MLAKMILPLLKSYAPNAIRHGAQVAAGALVANGFATGDQGTQIAGALVTIGAYVWSVLEKKGLLDKLFD
jgi:hypothetical protein